MNELFEFIGSGFCTFAFIRIVVELLDHIPEIE